MANILQQKAEPMSSSRISDDQIKSATSPIPDATRPQPAMPAVAKKQTQIAQNQMSQVSGPNPFAEALRESADGDEYSVNGEASPKRQKGATHDDERRLRKLKQGAASRPGANPSSDLARDAARKATAEADNAQPVDTKPEVSVRKSAAESQREFLLTTARMPKAAKSAPLLMEPARSLERIMHGDPFWKRSKQADAQLRANQAALV